MKNSFIVIILYFLLLIGTFIGILNDVYLLLLIGHSFSWLLMGIWLGFSRDWKFTISDKLIYVVTILASFADSVLLFNWDILGQFIQITFTLLIHTLLILIFRFEGINFNFKTQNQRLIVLFIIIIFFLGFGHILINFIPNLAYFVSVIYSVVECILIIHAIFRDKTSKSYIVVLIGVGMICLNDFMYIINFYVLNDDSSLFYAFQFSFNSIAHLVTLKGIQISLNAQSMK